MSKEAMKLALEAMQYADACLKKQLTTKTKHEYAQDLLLEAGKALEEALAKQEQGEPVTENGLYRLGYHNGYGFGEAYGKANAQQRTWVGLQDWEIKKLVGNDRYTDLLTAVAIAVEKELKARNI